MKDGSRQLLSVSKMGLITMFSTVAIISSSIAIGNIAEASDNQKLVFSSDLDWMKSEANLLNNNLTIDFSNRFKDLDAGTLQLDATTSQNVVSISKDKLMVNLAINGFGATVIKVTATDKNGETITDQFNLTVNKKGDINGDGIITPADASLIYQVTSGKLKLSEDELKALDINGDGKVTNADASLLMTTYVGKPTDNTINNNYYIKLEELNDAPIAKSDVYTASEDRSLVTDLITGVLKNDIDVEKNTLTAKTISGPAHGTLTMNTDGTFTYVPEANFSGRDQFTYIANDGKADSNEEKVMIDVQPVNDSPMANGGKLTVTEDLEAKGLLDGLDIDGDTLSFIIVENGKKGTVTIDDKTAAFTYKPNLNATGTDSFIFKVNDGTTDSNPVKVVVTINAVNDAPVANKDQFSVQEDSTLAGTSILLNDEDVENDSLTSSVVTGPAHGILTLHLDGTFTYSPNANFAGQDSFVYKANDGQAVSEEQIVTIDVQPVNDQPTVQPSSLVVTEDVAVAGTLKANDVDGDVLTYSIVENGQKGTVTISDPKTGSFLYQPNANANGHDSFTYKVNDGTVDSETVTLEVTINSVNDAPIANQDQFNVQEDTTLTVDTSILLNDEDVENDVLTASVVTGPTHGTVNLNQDGTFTYVPSANFAGQDSFIYKANDGSADSAVQTVTIDVLPVNDAPIAKEGTLQVTEDVSANGTLSGEDVEGDALTYILVENGKKGTVSLTNYHGDFVYTPNANAYGTDTFTFKVNDGQVDSETVTVEITILPVNDAPVLSDVSIQGSALVGETLEGNYTFTDVENDLEGNSQYQWYRAFQPDGSDKVAINGAKRKQYIVQDADVDQYLFFEVLPVAATGEQTTQSYFSVASGKIKPKDAIAPTIVSALPQNGAVGVSATDDFTITFSEKIKVGSGKISLYKDNDTLVDSFAANDIAHISVTSNQVIIKHQPLDSDTRYYVVVDTDAITDEAGNAFEGILGKTWSFATSGQSSITATAMTPLTEDYLKASGAFITIDLTGDTFNDSISASDFVLNNAPVGLTIQDANKVSETSAMLYLDFDGMDFDSVMNLSVSANTSATVNGRSATSNTMVVTPVIEASSAFISDFIRGSNNRFALQVYDEGTENPDAMSTGYELVVHQWVEATKQKRVFSIPMFPFYKKMPYIFIDSTFYDFFDITNAYYYNDELLFESPGSVLNAIVLKKDGKVVDVIGDPNSNAAKPLLPDGGTIVRKPTHSHGSDKYVKNDWLLYPKDTYQYIGRHDN